LISIKLITPGYQKLPGAQASKPLLASDSPEK
jgi:hypothetical protein